MTTKTAPDVSADPGSGDKKDLVFEVVPRGVGRSSSRKLRRESMVPAVVYGNNKQPLALALSSRLVDKYSSKDYDNKIFSFKSGEKTLNGLKVLKKETIYHKLTRKPIHLDFYSLDMNKKVRVFVEVRFTGKARGVKESGGVFSVISRQVEIECLPQDIPNYFSIDVSSLGINQNFHVSDLHLGKNIKLITSSAASLCSVVEVSEEEAPKPDTGAEAAPADGKPEEKAKKEAPSSSSGNASSSPSASPAKKAP